MTTRIYHHPDIFLHDAEANHVQMAGNRIAQVFNAVAAVPGVELVQAEPASLAQIERNHEPAFIANLIKRTPAVQGQEYRIDDETILNRHTWRAMQLSAGAACQAVDAVLKREAANAFCPVYAGHHARYKRAGGFCFINSVAIAARHALAQGAQRIAILDIDTHSGDGTVLSVLDINARTGYGTESTATGEPKVYFGETYQSGYPGSFLPGYCPDNVLRYRAGAPYQFWQGWDEILRKVAAFQPELILVSAGFDAHFNDPLGTIRLVDRDYTKIARDILTVSPHVVACLEGGYDVPTTARCAALFVQEMLAH
jgi:acetoin utilization deacetylase AcuC-like enzyme